MIRLWMGGLPIDIAEERIMEAVDRQLPALAPRSGGRFGLIRSAIKVPLSLIMPMVSADAEKVGYPKWDATGQDDLIAYSARWLVGLLLGELTRGEWQLDVRETAEGVEITGMAPATTLANGDGTGATGTPAISAPNVVEAVAGESGGPVGDPGHDGQRQDDVCQTLSA